MVPVIGGEYSEVGVQNYPHAYGFWYGNGGRSHGNGGTRRGEMLDSVCGNIGAWFGNPAPSNRRALVS